MQKKIRFLSLFLTFLFSVFIFHNSEVFLPSELQETKSELFLKEVSYLIKNDRKIGKAMKYHSLNFNIF